VVIEPAFDALDDAGMIGGRMSGKDVGKGVGYFLPHEFCGGLSLSDLLRVDKGDECSFVGCVMLGDKVAQQGRLAHAAASVDDIRTAIQKNGGHVLRATDEHFARHGA